MKVRLKHLWFGPSQVSNAGKLNQSVGRRFRPGVHVMPDEFKEFLPKSAEVLEISSPVPEPVKAAPGETLRDLDDVRKAAEELEAVEQDAEAERLRLRAEQMQRDLDAETAEPAKKKAGKKG